MTTAKSAKTQQSVFALDNVNKSKVEDAWVRKRSGELEKEIMRLQPQTKDHMNKKGKIELS